MCLSKGLNVELTRFANNPMLRTEPTKPLGGNINGPSVIAVPPWLQSPLGRYYMYFAHHRGEYIRLAYADDVRGPWTVYKPGTIHLRETRFDAHIASPDVHVDTNNQEIRMYFHGCCGPFNHESGTMDQVTDVATSTDGINFTVRGETLGPFYFRVWEYEDTYYAVANDGHLYRSDDPLAPFDQLLELFPRNRHFAVRFLNDDTLQFFLTRRGDRPERLMVAVMDLSAPVHTWRPDPHPPHTVMWPRESYEGGTLPLVTSELGPADEPVRALRDPAVLESSDRTYVFYAIAGEQGIAGAEVTLKSI